MTEKNEGSTTSPALAVSIFCDTNAGARSVCGSYLLVTTELRADGFNQ